MRMSWYAQRTQTVQSPAILRLLSNGDTTKRAGQRASVLLFTRLVGQPYVYCGPLDYFVHDPASSPIMFVWTLREPRPLLASLYFQQLLVAQPDQDAVPLAPPPPVPATLAGAKGPRVGVAAAAGRGGAGRTDAEPPGEAKVVPGSSGKPPVGGRAGRASRT